MTKSRNIGRGSTPTHGHSRQTGPSPTYNSWRGMKDRCKPDKQYGLLGISVCDRWLNFANFLEDMGERPQGHEIDRKNPLKNYEPKNCRWTLKRTNRQYRRTTILTEAKRKKVMRLYEAGYPEQQIAKRIGVSRSCINAYLVGRAWKPVNVNIATPPSLLVGPRGNDAA